MKPTEANLTINEVARITGVSRSTVSRVLTGHPNVKSSTRKQVEEVIQQLNYRPNPIARGLVRGSLNMIGLLVGDIRNPFYAEIARGVEDAATESNHMVALFNSDYDIEREFFYLKGAQQFGFGGLILMSVLDGEELVPVLKDMKCPIVMLNRYIQGFETDVVLVDNFLGGYLATEHLIKLGHTKIGHISGSPLSTASRERMAGYRQALQDNGLKARERDIFEGDLKMDSGREYAAKWLAQSNRPTAVFAANDLMAMGFIDALQEQELQVPRDVSVVGYDDLPYARVKAISLTTVRQPHYDMGATAMAYLMKRIQGKATFQQRMTLTPELVIRGTTAQPTT